jgi:cobalamin transport system substrate-binding protein
MRHPRILATALGSVLLMLVVGACGSDDDDAIPQTGNAPTTTAADEAAAAPESGGGTFPVTIDAANGPVEIAAQPERIVSLSPTGTEMLFAIDAGDQVVAVDSQSTFPDGVPTTDLSGFETNVEAVAAEEPDLVVMATDNNDAFAGFAELSIPVLSLPPATDLDQSYAQIEQLGQATGHVDQAADLADTVGSEIDSIVAEVTGDGEPSADRPTYYHELDNTGYTATTETFIGQVYEQAGLSNVATQPSTDGSGYVQLSPEFVVQQDPDWIFLAYPVDGDPVAAVSDRPGWSELTAVQEGHVVALDPDIASRWGPRTPELLQTIVDAVYGEAAGGGSADSSTTTAG